MALIWRMAASSASKNGLSRHISGWMLRCIRIATGRKPKRGTNQPRWRHMAHQIKMADKKLKGGGQLHESERPPIEAGLRATVKRSKKATKQR